MSLPRKTKITYSVIIPTYNQTESLKKLLTHLVYPVYPEPSRRKRSRRVYPERSRRVPPNTEIIVIDDGSTDKTHQIVKKFKIKFHRLKTNQGPAHARNLGAKLAQGEILIFFDADVVPMKNSLKEVINFFQKNPQAQAVSGFWAKTQAKKSFFSQYKALRDWSYFFNEPENQGIYYFTPRVAAIKKNVFLKVGGFNTKYKKPDLESLEFSFRLRKITPIYFNPQFLVKHQFEGAWVQTKNYFKRTYLFLSLFSTYRQFCRTVSTPKEALNVLLAILSLLTFILSLFLKPIFLALPFVFALYLYRQRKFLLFFYSQKSFLFTLGSFLFNYFLHLVIFAGVVCFIFAGPLRWLKRRNQ